MDSICAYCGYRNTFEIEEDTNKVYCIVCGHYVELNILVEE